MATSSYDINRRRADIINAGVNSSDLIPDGRDIVQMFDDLARREGYTLEHIKKYLDLYVGAVPGDLEKNLERIRNGEYSR